MLESKNADGNNNEIEESDYKFSMDYLSSYSIRDVVNHLLSIGKAYNGSKLDTQQLKENPATNQLIPKLKNILHLLAPSIRNEGGGKRRKHKTKRRKHKTKRRYKTKRK